MPHPMQPSGTTGPGPQGSRIPVGDTIFQRVNKLDQKFKKIAIKVDLMLRKAGVELVKTIEERDRNVIVDYALKPIKKRKEKI